MLPVWRQEGLFVMANFIKRGGKKNRKHGRNKDWCQAYLARGQREKSKAVRLHKHFARHPTDLCAVAALSQVAPSGVNKLAA